MLKYVAALLSVVSAIHGLDDYLDRPEPDYGWFENTEYKFTSILGNTGYVLNVTS